mmetsp:Transcript_30545/g.63109  ORF Transcript_30545/g.63109 Transcript_30545/m.63109 type:complete len:300 (-) Transcript_30545:128-1027(-)
MPASPRPPTMKLKLLLRQPRRNLARKARPLRRLPGRSQRRSEVDDVDSSSDDNESLDPYPCITDWNPDLPPTHIDITSQRVCFQCVSDTPDAYASVDSGANVSLSPTKAHVLQYTGGDTNVTGMSGPAQRCPNVRLGIPTVSRDGEPLLLEVPGPSLLHEGANGILLAHGSMQRAGFEIKMRTGTRHNATDGGYIRIPDGRVVDLIYDNNLYYLPVHTPVTKRANRARYLTPAPALQPSPNPFALLSAEPSDSPTASRRTLRTALLPASTGARSATFAGAEASSAIRPGHAHANAVGGR